MPNFVSPPAAVRAEIARPLRLKIVSPSAQPQDGAGWLHEVKNDGHRLLAIVGDGDITLISRNGYDRTAVFRAPFDKLAAAGCRRWCSTARSPRPTSAASPTSILTEALRHRQPERLAYFSFDLLHLDGHDLRQCAIEDRKALLRDVIGAGGDERIACIDYITGSGQQLFEAVRQVGVGGIVSKRAGSAYRSGESRDWLKTKVSETAAFVITGFRGLGPGRLEALAVAELQAGVLAPAGMVIFGFAGKHLWSRLERLRAGPANRSGIVPVWPELVAAVRYFGRYRSGAIRDGVLLSVG